MATELISLSILFACSIIGGLIAYRFKQPAVLGLLVVGALIGPNTLNIVKDIGIVNMFVDFGAVILLFLVGLEFDLKKLMRFGTRTILTALLKNGITIFVGYEAAVWFGFSTKAALFIGVILSFSSTVIIVKVLEQKSMYNRKEVPFLVSVLIIEDILAVATITFFSGVRNRSLNLVSSIEHITLSLALLILTYFITLKLIKYVINIISKSPNDDHLTFLSLALCGSFSYLALTLGLSPSAGAFIAGSIVASLPNSKSYARAISPYVLISTSIFFISIGTLVNFGAIGFNLRLIMVMVLIVLITRLFAVSIITSLLANFKREQPIFSGIAMISIGEFSLLIAKESSKYNLGIDLVTITSVVIFVTAVIMSLSINYSENIYSAISSRTPLRWKNKIEYISEKIRNFFDQIEVENFFTKKFKKEINAAIIWIGILILFSFTARRMIMYIISLHVNRIPLYTSYILVSSTAIVLTYIFYRKSLLAYNTLAVIISNISSSHNIKRSKKILNNLIAALLITFLALLSPFIMFVTNFGMLFNLVPFLLFILAIYFVRGIFTNKSTSIYQKSSDSWTY